MAWVRIDDDFHAHPKVQQAWHACPTSIGLHALAMSHCARYLTDGHVSQSFAKTCLPGAAGRKRAVGALVAAGLWVPQDGGWQIHDYLDFNPSREQVLSDRAELSEVRAAAGRKGAKARWQTGWQTDGKPMAPAVDGKPMAPYPVPSPFPEKRP
jgi:hypothetical protein